VTKSEAKHQRAANPAMNEQDALETAGGVARWKMTGDQGNLSKHLLEKMALSKVKAAVQKFSSRPNSKSTSKRTGPVSQPNGSRCLIDRLHSFFIHPATVHFDSGESSFDLTKIRRR